MKASWTFRNRLSSVFGQLGFSSWVWATSIHVVYWSTVDWGQVSVTVTVITLIDSSCSEVKTIVVFLLNCSFFFFSFLYYCYYKQFIYLSYAEFCGVLSVLRFVDKVATGAIDINQIGMTREWGNRGNHSGGFFQRRRCCWVVVLVVVVVIYELTSAAFVLKLFWLSLGIFAQVFGSPSPNTLPTSSWRLSSEVGVRWRGSPAP